MRIFFFCLLTLDERTIFRACDNLFIARQPLHACNRLFVSFDKGAITVNFMLSVILLPLSIAAKLIRQLIKQFILLLEHGQLHSAGQLVILPIENVLVYEGLRLQSRKKVLFLLRGVVFYYLLGHFESLFLHCLLHHHLLIFTHAHQHRFLVWLVALRLNHLVLSLQLAKLFLHLICSFCADLLLVGCRLLLYLFCHILN